MDEHMQAALAELRAEIPKLACKGKCQYSCVTLIDASHAEYEGLAEHGIHMPPRSWLGSSGMRAICPALERDGTCSIHPDNPNRVAGAPNPPMICQLWGTTDAPSMRCAYGCIPDHWLEPVQAYRLLLRSFGIGGHPMMDKQPLEAWLRKTELPGFAGFITNHLATSSDSPEDQGRVEAFLEEFYAGRIGMPASEWRARRSAQTSR